MKDDDQSSVSFQLLVTRHEKNSLFDAEVEREAHRREEPFGYSGRSHVCQPEYLDRKALEVELTEEQFTAKKAVLEVL